MARVAKVAKGLWKLEGWVAWVARVASVAKGLWELKGLGGYGG